MNHECIAKYNLEWRNVFSALGYFAIMAEEKRDWKQNGEVNKPKIKRVVYASTNAAKINNTART
jgi:hypothetical protein